MVQLLQRIETIRFQYRKTETENVNGRARAEPDGTRAETTFRLLPKWTSPFKSAGESVQSTAGS